MSLAFRALGTTVVVASIDSADDEPARAAVAVELDALDRACSRFRADSELSRVNRARGRPTQVSSVLAEAVGVALDAAHATGGLVDPTVGRTLRLSGYDATFNAVAARDGRTFSAHFCPVPGWQLIELDRERRVLRVANGVELDLGATAKALASDRAAAAAASVTGGALVSIGGDIATAGETPAEGWAVRIAENHAEPLDTPGPTVALAGGALATSSTTVRRWRSGADELHHLVDPRTGRPAVSPWRTVTVAAATCVEANIASTASFLVDDACGWLQAARLPARLVSVAGALTFTAGWPEDAG